MPKSNIVLTVLGVMLMVGLVGCTPGGVKGVRAFEDLPPAEGEVVSDAAFLYELANKESCSTDDAYRGILYFVDGADTSSTFQERTARVRMHGLIKADWKHVPQAPITKGKVAYMFARALEFPGGVMYNITNAGPRYALRELIYKDIIRIGSEEQKVSGAEYVGILGRADDYRLAAGERGKGPFPNWPFISD